MRTILPARTARTGQPSKPRPQRVPAPPPPPPVPALTRSREEVLRYLSPADKLAGLPEDIAKFVFAVACRIPLPPGKKLLEHQAIGTTYGLVSRFRMLLGDAQGLGKTCQGVAMLSLGGSKLIPAVLVAPASVLHDWMAAFKEWGPWFRQVPLLKRDSHVTAPKGPTVYLTTWDLLPWHQVGLRHVGVRTLLADEVSFGKHATARRSGALADLASHCPYVVFLSGTAAENDRKELWHVLHLLDGKRFADVKAFRELAEDPEALANVLPEFMCRRLKTDVLEALPPKKRSIVLLDLPATALTQYRRAQADMWAWVAGQRRQRVLVEAVDKYRRALAVARMAKADEDEAELFARTLFDANSVLASRTLDPTEVALLKFGELRRLVGRAKVLPALQWIRTWFGAGGPGERVAGGPSPRPVILFGEHQPVVLGLRVGCERLGLRVGLIDGATNKTTRRALTQAFQAGQLDVMIGSTAMAFGVTLTRSSDVLFVERYFKPTLEEQAEDRAHRLGQAREVHVRKLVARGTVDEAITELVDRKAHGIAAVMGAEDVDVQAGGAALDFDASFAAQVATAMWTGGVVEDVGNVKDGLRPFTAEELRTALGMSG